jgi:hypothetical protein
LKQNYFLGDFFDQFLISEYEEEAENLEQSRRNYKSIHIMKKLLLLCIAVSFASFVNAQTLLGSGGYGPGYATFTRDTLGTDVNGNTLGKLSINVGALPANQHVIDMELIVFVEGGGTDPDQFWYNQAFSGTSLDQSYAFNPYPGYSVQVEYDWCVIYQDDDNNTTTDYYSERYYY